MVTEPPPAPPQLPTPGSEQIGFLKTINCSCPAGEKVVHPAFTILPQSPVASELSVAGQAGWQDRSESELKEQLPTTPELPDQGGPRLSAHHRVPWNVCFFTFVHDGREVLRLRSN